MFCAVWALDIAPTLDVLVLFYRPQTSHWKVDVFVQLELRICKTYWIRHDLVQNKTIFPGPTTNSDIIKNHICEINQLL